MKEPRFDRDYKFGRQGEILVDNVLEWIAAGDSRVEVKTLRDPDYVWMVEVEQNAFNRGVWRPSGIRVTESEWQAVVLGDPRTPNGIVFLPTATVLAEADRLEAKFGTKLCGTDGDNPTKCVRADIKKLLGW